MKILELMAKHRPILKSRTELSFSISVVILLVELPVKLWTTDQFAQETDTVGRVVASVTDEV